jgi:hypothetical protein
MRQSALDCNAGLNLLPQHLEDLRRSGLSDETIRACGFFSLADPKRVSELLRWQRPARQLGPCLAIPFRGPSGLNGYVRLKPDRPRKAKQDGKPVKYESPLGLPNRLYVPPHTAATLNDPTADLIITEGEKKAAKADQEGFACVGLVGVEGWSKKRPKDKPDAPRELIDDLAAVAWEGRNVFIAYDSDAAQKEGVRWGEWNLAEALAAQGAVVKVVRLPADEPAKVGLDDYLVAHGAEAFRRLLESAQPPTRPPTIPRPSSAEEPHLTDRGNAMRMIAEHGDDLQHCLPWKKWFIWSENRWRLDDTAAATWRAKLTVKTLYTQAIRLISELAQGGIDL